MTVSNILDLKEIIVIKAEQISALALVAQAGSIEELTIDKIESLFGLFIDLSTDITSCADRINISSRGLEIM